VFAVLRIESYIDNTVPAPILKRNENSPLFHFLFATTKNSAIFAKFRVSIYFFTVKKQKLHTFFYYVIFSPCIAKLSLFYYSNCSVYKYFCKKFKITNFSTEKNAVSYFSTSCPPVYRPIYLPLINVKGRYHGLFIK
jgi:hypothetical protein